MRVLAQGNPLQVTPEPFVALRRSSWPFVDNFFGRRGPASIPHRISLCLSPRLPRLPINGGVIAPGSAGVPPASLFLMGVADHQRDFAGSHHVGGNRNGGVNGEA